MSDMPERIWADPGMTGLAGYWRSSPHELDDEIVEYVRADVLAAKDAEIANAKDWAMREARESAKKSMMITAKDAAIERLRAALRELAKEARKR